MKFPEELEFIRNARLPQKTTETRLDGKICVLTGATSGVGYAAARRLAKAGATLVTVCRNPAKSSELSRELQTEFGTRTHEVIADFSSLPQVETAAKQILNSHPRIDVLVNNAGMHSTRRILTESGHEQVFCVNHLASFLLTMRLLERLKACAPSRIIQVNSQGHRFGGLDIHDLDWAERRYRGIKGYGASKTAQLFTVAILAERLAGSGVTINAVHPGAVRSNIGANNGLVYRLYNRFVVGLFLGDPAVSGNAIHYLAASPELSQTSGQYFNLTIPETPARHARDAELGQKVWDLSMQLAGV